MLSREPGKTGDAGKCLEPGIAAIPRARLAIHPIIVRGGTNGRTRLPSSL
jgi:hypothetical protein